LKAVINASPLIFLAKLDYTEALAVFDEVLTSDVVIEEVVAGADKGFVDALRIKRLEECGKLTVVKAGHQRDQLKGLHLGELSVLKLAMDRKIKDVIIDDRHAIAAARYFGLRPVSTPFLLLLNVKKGRLTKKRFRSLMDGLIEHGYYISPKLYMKILEMASEF
jgi:predicted nucleic acid-binding protein